MNVLIEDKQIIIGGNVLDYYPYYFVIWNRNIDHRITVKQVITQWAEALSTLTKPEESVFLPYDLNDQISGFLKASLDEDEIVLTDVLAGADGFAMSLDNLNKYIYKKHKVIETRRDRFGQWNKFVPRYIWRYKKQDLMDGLRDAKLAQK